MKRLSRKNSIIGNKYGRLTVIEYIGLTNENRTWKCQCECGNFKNVITSSLTQKKTNSCGCLAAEIRKNKPNQYKLAEGISTRNATLYSYKYSAKKRNIEWNLSDEFVFELFENNCSCCGIKPNSTIKHINSNGCFTYNGIDRIDNNKGYLPDNVQTLCKRCNIAKNNMNQIEFNEWIKRIVENNKND